MPRILAAALLTLTATFPASASEPLLFWDLPPNELRLLVASPQVMVTRTAKGYDAYCRCPVILKPSEIPEVMKKAIIAVEDKRFMDHGGVDLIALAGVLRGGLSRGGSTIPMQLMKNLVLHDLRQDSIIAKIERKGTEVLNAGVFDGAVGKQELLAAYLNQVEFGGREVVGLYRASRYYFRKEPRDLNLYEAALLAGMVQAPARLNPLKEGTRERAHERARLVLDLMVKQGRITAAEQARAMGIGLRPGILPPFKIQAQAFTEWVTQSLAPHHVKEGETLRFFVTLDARHQRLAERHLADLVTEGAIPPEYEAGLVAMTGDGRVRAMVGGTDWSKRQFNTAVKAQVQLGSTAKLPLVVAACEAGLRPESRVTDLPVIGEWPSNGALGYRGETTLQEAIASSRNAAAVRLAVEIGVGRVARTSRALGLDPGPEADPAFVLGTYSTSVLTVTAAYTAVANGGFRVAPTGVLAVVDGRGVVRARFIEQARARVISGRCVEPTRQILREVVRSGTGQRASLRTWPVYGKTGTTTGNADAWFVGWSEGRVMGVWMGRRRDASGEVLAGRGAPADLFRRVAGSVNGLTDARLEPARSLPQVARTKPAKPNLPKPVAEARQAKPRFAPTPLLPRETWPADEWHDDIWTW
ncbi:MAG TPA: transglycosylase domain-containing protein [Beijerinckiaceae bacterium]|jgi:penicillin-binding protein 1A